MKNKNKFQKLLMVLADVSDEDLKAASIPNVQEPIITDLTAFHIQMPTPEMCERLKSAVGRYALVMTDPNDNSSTTFGAILPLSDHTQQTLYDRDSFTEWLRSEAALIANQ